MNSNSEIDGRNLTSKRMGIRLEIWICEARLVFQMAVSLPLPEAFLKSIYGIVRREFQRKNNFGFEDPEISEIEGRISPQGKDGCLA